MSRLQEVVMADIRSHTAQFPCSQDLAVSIRFTIISGCGPTRAALDHRNGTWCTLIQMIQFSNEALTRSRSSLDQNISSLTGGSGAVS